MGESKGKGVGNNHGFSIKTVRSPAGGNCQYIERDCRDYVQVKPYEGVFAKECDFVAAAGLREIPKELKSPLAVTFISPNIVFNYPKVMPEDPIERSKVLGPFEVGRREYYSGNLDQVLDEIHQKAVKEFNTNMSIAFDKFVRSEVKKAMSKYAELEKVTADALLMSKEVHALLKKQLKRALVLFKKLV